MTDESICRKLGLELRSHWPDVTKRYVISFEVKPGRHTPSTIVSAYIGERRTKQALFARAIRLPGDDTMLVVMMDGTGDKPKPHRLTRAFEFTL